MDPVSILGLAGTAFSVVERVAKITTFFVKLSTRFKTVNAKIASLIGYLATLNASISEISDIIEGLSEHERYKGLADSLATTLNCTTISMSFLEAMVAGLRLEGQDEASLLNKITVLLKSEEFDEYLGGINTYINALNLHLNVLQSRSLLEQKGILNSADAKQVIEAMKDETSSLLCIADNRSMTSRSTEITENSVGLDISFEFDSELLSSNSYTAAYRSHLRQALTTGRQGINLAQNKSSTQALDVHYDLPNVTPQAAERQAIEGLPAPNDSLNRSGNVQISSSIEVTSQPRGKSSEAIQGESRTTTLANLWSRRARSQSWIRKNAVPKSIEHSNNKGPLTSNLEWPKRDNNLKCLLLGDSESGKSTWLKTFKLFEGSPYTTDEHESFKEIILSNLIQSARAVLEAMESFEMELADKDLAPYAHTILMQPKFFEANYLPAEVGNAIKALRQDTGFQSCMQRRGEYHLIDVFDL
jgi:hypothetical protein